MRGPGFLNAVMVIEHIMEHVALHLGLDPVAVKECNFLQSIPPSLVRSCLSTLQSQRACSALSYMRQLIPTSLVRSCCSTQYLAVLPLL